MDKQNENVIHLIGYAYSQCEKMEYAAAITDAAKWYMPFCVLYVKEEHKWQ